MAEDFAGRKGIFRSEEEKAEDKKVDAELSAVGLGDLDGFRGSAEEALEKIKEFISVLAGVVTHITPELLKEDRVSFRRNLEWADQQSVEFNILSAMFKAQVEIQYPRVPLSQKFAVLVLGLFRGLVSEATILQTFGGNKRKRMVLLGAWEELGKQFDYCMRICVRAEKLLEEERLAPIKLRQAEILRTDKSYQDILDQLDEAKTRLAPMIFLDTKYESVVAEVEKWQVKKERKEDEALEQAQSELLKNTHNEASE
jgi:hypothetical protein